MEKTLRAPFRLFKINLRSDLFSSVFTTGSMALVRLGSSLILTRLLTPSVYGLFAILLSFAFTIELMSDVGPAALIIRHPRGGDVEFVHTIWTIRLFRSVINFALLFIAAPFLAELYKEPGLTWPCRLLSISFLLGGAESMSYVLAQRHQKARIGNYAGLFANVVMTVAVIYLSFKLRNVYALLFGFLLQRALLTVVSYFFYREIGIGLAFDRQAVREQLQFARVVTPSSVITILLNQYDKLVFLRLFNADLLGIYSVAGNMLGPVRNIIMTNTRLILYARCAEYVRSDRSTARQRYYSENTKLIHLGMLLPAVIAGFSQSIVSILYDPRYQFGGYVLMALGLGAMISAFANASENFLVAAGLTRAVLIGNALTLASLVPASLIGYHIAGMKGFLWFNLVAAFVPMIYLYHQQRKLQLLKPAIELRWFATALGAFFACLMLSHIFLAIVPQNWLHLHFKQLLMR